MLATIATAAGKAILSIVMKLATAEAIEELMIWAMEKAAAITETKIDDELVAKIKERVDG